MRFLIFILLIFLQGCGSTFSYHDIHEAAKVMVDTSDGVNEDEAILLALRNILNKGLADRLYNLEPYKIYRKYVWIRDGKRIVFMRPPSSTFQFPVQDTWVVLFKDKENTFFFGIYPVIPFYTEVDAGTGEIVEWGLKKEYE